MAGQEVDHHRTVRVQYLSAEITGEPAAFSGCYYRQDFSRLQPGVRVLARFADGRPAAFEQAYGAGRAALVGTFPALAVAMGQECDSAGFITRWMKPCGYDSLVELCAGEQTLVRLHQYFKKTYVCAVNYAPGVQEVHLLFDRPVRLGSQPEGLRAALDRHGLRLQVPARDGVLIWLEEA